MDRIIYLGGKVYGPGVKEKFIVDEKGKPTAVILNIDSSGFLMGDSLG
jgi:hypothetical protein